MTHPLSVELTYKNRDNWDITQWVDWANRAENELNRLQAENERYREALELGRISTKDLYEMYDDEFYRNRLELIDNALQLNPKPIEGQPEDEPWPASHDGPELP